MDAFRSRFRRLVANGIVRGTCWMLSSLAITSPAHAADPRAQWGQWRGPLQTGVAPEANPPVEWSEERNVRWKSALPGTGHSTPVVWEDRLYLTTAIPFGDPVEPVYDEAPGSHDNLPVSRHHRFVVLAVDRERGKLLWERPVNEAFPHEGGHVSGSLASHSPVTDGEHVIAFFGSRGLYALNPDGEIVWEKSLGRMNSKHGHGEGASPVIHGDTVVVNWDHEGQSMIYAFDKKTGAERWKVPRDEPTSWATPIVVEFDGRVQIVVSGTNRIRSYDVETGDVMWECGGLSQNVVASPVAGDGYVYCGSSYVKRALLGIRLKGAKGDLTDTEHVVWKTNQRTPYVPSPLLYDNTLYFLAHYQGVLSCLVADSGKTKAGPFRLDNITNVYASPVAAAGRIYITDREGTTLVLEHGAKPKPVALNRLDDVFSASAALAGDSLFLRGEKHLYCLAESTE